MRRLALASLIVLFAPSSAEAGGWWSSVQTDRSTVAAGQRVAAEADVLFRSARAAREADGEEYFVYALRGLDQAMLRRAMSAPAPPSGWWSLGDADAVELGRVVLRVSGGNLGYARASFTVPDLPPAAYSLMLCDAGCARPLADVVPTPGFTVAADPALAARVATLEERAARQARSLAAVRAAARRARVAVASADAEIRALEAQVHVLRRDAADAARPATPSRWPLAGWVLAGALAALTATVLLRRRSPKAPPSAFDDELAALVAAERARARRPRARA